MDYIDFIDAAAGIIRQYGEDNYYVLDESVEDKDGRFSWGTDESDMVLYGMSWHKPSGTFGHEHVFYTRGGTELVAPAALPENQRMLAGGRRNDPRPRRPQPRRLPRTLGRENAL